MLKPILICHGCQRRNRVNERTVVCTIDGKPLHEHAAERYCPEGRYELGLGDKIAAVLHKTGIAGIVKRITRKPCGCKKRQQKLNEAFPTPQRIP